MAAIEAVVGVDVDDRINDLRQQEREYVNMIGRMTPQQEREYMNIVNEIRRLEYWKRRQERPTLFQRVSTFLAGRRTAPVTPVEAEEEPQVAQFMD